MRHIRTIHFFWIKFYKKHLNEDCLKPTGSMLSSFCNMIQLWPKASAHASMKSKNVQPFKVDFKLFSSSFMRNFLFGGKNWRNEIIWISLLSHFTLFFIYFVAHLSLPSHLAQISSICCFTRRKRNYIEK